jgi:Flp pilus assembly protein TadD
MSPSTIGHHAMNVPEEDIDSLKQFLPDSYAQCSCASGKKYKFCCKKIVLEITMAMAAAEEGNKKEALQWIEKAKALVGETAEVLCREAIVYSFFDAKKGQSLIEKCLRLNPNHPRTHYIHAIDLKQHGDFSAAKIAYETAIAHYPESDHFHLNEAYNNLGGVFLAMNDLVGAKSAWEKALLYMPSDEMTQKNLREFIYMDNKKVF